MVPLTRPSQCFWESQHWTEGRRPEFHVAVSPKLFQTDAVNHNSCSVRFALNAILQWKQVAPDTAVLSQAEIICCLEVGWDLNQYLHRGSKGYLWWSVMVYIRVGALEVFYFGQNRHFSRKREIQFYDLCNLFSIDLSWLIVPLVRLPQVAIEHRHHCRGSSVSCRVADIQHTQMSFCQSSQEEEIWQLTGLLKR